MKDLGDERMAEKELTQSLAIPLTKKGDLKKGQSYRTVGLIIAGSAVLLNS